MYQYELEQIRKEIDDGLKFYMKYDNFINEFQAGFNEGCFVSLDLLRANIEKILLQENIDLKNKLNSLIKILNECVKEVIDHKDENVSGYNHGFKFICKKFVDEFQNLIIKIDEKGEIK